jgi:hypothetical protein
MRRTKRIYYGPPGNETALYWTVAVSDARQKVIIDGALRHALKGRSGLTIGCALSNTAFDPKNKSAFPHPVYMAVFNRTTALMVDKLGKNGAPSHAIKYDHSYSWVTDRNDDKTLKKIAADDPEVIERPFVLRPPKIRRGQQASRHPNRSNSPNKRTIASHLEARGALARAIKAGHITKAAATQLIQSIKAA